MPSIGFCNNQNIKAEREVVLELTNRLKLQFLKEAILFLRLMQLEQWEPMKIVLIQEGTTGMTFMHMHASSEITM